MMRLNRVQRLLLGILKLDADLDLSEVARRLGVTPKTVRYNVDALVRRRIMTRANFIDLYPLGLRSVNVYFSVSPGGARRHEKLVGELAGLSSVTWVGELGGDFHYGAAFAVSRFEAIREELMKFGPDVRASIDERTVTQHLSLTMFPLKIYGGAPSQERIRYGGVSACRTLDPLGWGLLRLLGDEPELSIRDLARRVGRSASAVNDRIADLREEGILRGGWYRVDFEALSLSTFKLLVYGRCVDSAFATQLRGFCRDHRNVDHLIECLGPWDFEIGVVAESPDQVTATMRSLHERFPDAIRQVKVLPLLRVLKWRQVPPERPGETVLEAPVTVRRVG